MLIVGASLCSYFVYQHYYVETLKLSEIVGPTDDTLMNIAVNFLDYDTGPTRNDIRRLKNNKDYWLERIKEIDSIKDIERNAQENAKLLEEMSEDPSMKKIIKGSLQKTTDFLFKILN